MSDPSKIEIAQLETLATVSSSTRLLVQDGVAGTPYRQTTVGDLIAGLVDDIGVGTIVAGTVVIAAGTADLDVLSSTTADFGTVSIGGGTGTLSSLGVSGLVSGGTVTAGIGSFTTLNAGTVDLSSGKMVVATGSVTTLTATTGTVTALNTGTLTATGGTATLASGTITALNTGTLTATGGTAALSSGTITSATASTLAVSGTATVATMVGTSVSAGTLAVSGTSAVNVLTGTLISSGSVAVSGTTSVNLITGTTAAIATISGTTAGISGVTTLGTLIVSTATASSGDTRWGILEGVVTDADGYPLAARDPLTGRSHEGGMTIGDMIATTGTIATAILTTGSITTATAGTLISGGGTVSSGDSRWSIFGSVVLDDDGWPIAADSENGTAIVQAANIGTLTLGGDPTTSLMAATKAYVDANAGGSLTAYSDGQLRAMDAAAAARSMAVHAQINDSTAAPVWEYSHVIHYGQSYALGFGASLISTSALVLTGLFSFGARPANTVDTDVFTQSGSATFQTMTVSAGAEVPALGMAYYLRRAQLAAYNLASDATRQIVINAAGKGGQTVAQLSKGATPTEIYAQVTDLVDKSITAAASDPYGVAAVCYLQGEADATGGTSGSSYQTALQTLFDDLRDDIVAATGQDYPPVIFLVQTGGRWDDTLQDNSVSNAQVAIAQADPGVILIGPYYAYSDNGTHLDSDGYRNLGEMFGKVANTVLVQRKGWLPCHLRTATFRGARIWLDIHTPYPPLQVKQVYEQTTLTSVADHGFFVEDDNGAVTIDSITLYNSGIMIECAADLVAADNPIVGYANYATTGNGNICDSDPAISYHLSTATSAPYPMNNWLCSFRTAITEDV